MKNIILVLLAFIICTACADYEKKDKPPKTLNLGVEVTHQNDSHYAIHFKDNKEWSIVVNDQQEDIDWSEAKGVEVTEGVYITPKAHEKRQYFGLFSNEQDTLILSNKHINLEGAHNFRDIGGIKTKDGKFIKMGRIYRSDKLSELTESDLNTLQRLGVRSVNDLRTQTEVDKEPDNIPEKSGITYRHLPVGNDSLMAGSEKEMMQKLKDLKPKESEKFMIDATANFPIDYKESYKKLYAQLNKEQLPLVFHCTAGKDRTGLATALLLDVLGVNKDVIYDDYLMSNFYRYDFIEEKVKKASIYGIDHKVLRPFMDVRKKYLVAAFDKIESEYGSVENYFKKGLGFTEEDISKWKNELLY